MSKPCPKCGESCYAKLLNGVGKKVYREDEFCPKCEAHLAASGICLNACHLTERQQKHFGLLMAEMVAEVDRKRKKEAHGEAK